MYVSAWEIELSKWRIFKLLILLLFIWIILYLESLLSSSSKLFTPSYWIKNLEFMDSDLHLN